MNSTSVELWTRDDGYVTTVKIPRFAPLLPDVIAWGERVFVRHPDGRYREAFFWRVVVPRTAAMRP